MTQQPDSPSHMKVFVTLATVTFFALTWTSEVLTSVGLGWLYPPPFIRALSLALPYFWLVLWGQRARQEGFDMTILAVLPTILFWVNIAQWGLSILMRRRVHSRSSGFPLLKLPLFFLPTTFIKEWVQPAILAGLGYHYFRLNPPVFSFLFAVGVGSWVVGRIRHFNSMVREQGFTDSLYQGW